MLEGSCLCGGIRYRYDGEITELSLCHCSQCRRPWFTITDTLPQYPEGKPA